MNNERGQKGMEAFMSFVDWVGRDYVMILLVIFAICSCFIKIEKSLRDSNEARINTALDAVKKEILIMMSDAEVKWKNYPKAGQLKRSEVFQKIFEKYPVLKEHDAQDDIEKIVDEYISEYLKETQTVVNDKSFNPATDMVLSKEDVDTLINAANTLV